MDKAWHADIILSPPTSLCPDPASVTREEALVVINLQCSSGIPRLGFPRYIAPGGETVVIILISQRKKLSQERLSGLHHLT